MSEGPKIVSENQTGGEKLFNWVAYQGLGWLTNAFVGIQTYKMSTDKDALKSAQEKVAQNEQDGVNGIKAFADKAGMKTREAVFNAREGAVNWSRENVADKIFLENGEYKSPATERVIKAVSNAKDLETGMPLFLDAHASQDKVKNGTVVFSDKIPAFNKDNAQQFFFDRFSESGNNFDALAEATGQSVEDIKLARDTMVNHKRWRDASKTIATATAISAGGFAVMIPIKIMEDNKLPLVKKFDKVVDKFNELTGNGFASEFDKQQTMEKREERYKEIEEEPKQTWSSVLTSRVLSVVPFYFIYAGIANKDNIISGAAAKISGNEYNNLDAGFQGWEKHAEDGSKFAIDKARMIPVVGGKIPENGTQGHKGLVDTVQMYATDMTFSYLVANVTYGMTRLFAPILGNTDNVPKADDAEKAPQKVNEEAKNNIQSFNREKETAVKELPASDKATPKAIIATAGSIKDGALQERELQRI